MILTSAAVAAVARGSIVSSARPAVAYYNSYFRPVAVPPPLLRECHPAAAAADVRRPYGRGNSSAFAAYRIVEGSSLLLLLRCCVIRNIGIVCRLLQKFQRPEPPEAPRQTYPNAELFLSTIELVWTVLDADRSVLQAMQGSAADAFLMDGRCLVSVKIYEMRVVRFRRGFLRGNLARPPPPSLRLLTVDETTTTTNNSNSSTCRSGSESGKRGEERGKNLYREWSVLF